MIAECRDAPVAPRLGQASISGGPFDQNFGCLIAPVTVRGFDERGYGVRDFLGVQCRRYLREVGRLGLCYWREPEQERRDDPKAEADFQDGRGHEHHRLLSGRSERFGSKTFHENLSQEIEFA